jgi:hypothetical protein
MSVLRMRWPAAALLALMLIALTASGTSAQGGCPGCQELEEAIYKARATALAANS